MHVACTTGYWRVVETVELTLSTGEHTASRLFNTIEEKLQEYGISVQKKTPSGGSKSTFIKFKANSNSDDEIKIMKYGDESIEFFPTPTKTSLHIIIKGVGDREPTIDNTRLTVSKGVKLTLENLTFRRHAGRQIKIVDGGEFHMKNCTIHDGYFVESAVVHAEGNAVVDIRNSTIKGGTIYIEDVKSSLNMIEVSMTRTEQLSPYGQFEIYEPLGWNMPKIIAKNSTLTLKVVSIADSDGRMHRIRGVENMIVDDEYNGDKLMQQKAQ
jgi:uncharacterized protein (UPF0179 family)